MVLSAWFPTRHIVHAMPFGVRADDRQDDVVERLEAAGAEVDQSVDAGMSLVRVPCLESAIGRRYSLQFAFLPSGVLRVVSEHDL
jgi:hypothetical protein